MVDPVSNATTSGSSSGDHQGTNGSKKRKAPASAEKLAKEAEAKKKWGKRKIITPEEKVGIVEWHEKYGHGNKEVREKVRQKERRAGQRDILEE